MSLSASHAACDSSVDRSSKAAMRFPSPAADGLAPFPASPRLASIATWGSAVVLLALGAASASAQPLIKDSDRPARATEVQGPQVETRLATEAGDDIDVPRLPSRRDGHDWAEFLGPERDGICHETGIRTDWATDPPRLVWERQVGDGYAIGSIAYGRYVHFERVVENGRELPLARVMCLKAESGEELWRYEYPTAYEDTYGYDGGPRCSPVIDGHRIYVFGPEGMLICLDIRDGTVIWQRNTTTDYGVVQNFFGVGSTPIVVGDLLWVMIGGSPPESQGFARSALDRVTDDDSALVAFDKRTGEERRRFGKDLASYSSLTVKTIGGREWGLAFCRGGLIAFDPRDDGPVHHFPWRSPKLESVNASMPIVADDLILISETYGPGAAVLRLGADGFDVVWSDEDAGRDQSLLTHWNTPIHRDGFVYASSGRHTANAELRCVELATGEVRWSVPRLTRCSLTYVDGHLLCLGEEGTVRLLKVNPDRFEQVSVMTVRSEDTGDPLLDYPCWAAPVVSHGLLYLRGARRIVCLELIPAD